MKKGLRPPATLITSPTLNSNSRPDEEGIKTIRRSEYPPCRRNSNSRPDEEGIKTHHAHDLRVALHSNSRPDEEGIKTRSIRPAAERRDSNSRPDEEGIKTNVEGLTREAAIFQQQT